MYTKSITPAFEQVGKRKELTGYLGELHDGETLLHSMEYSTNSQAEAALDALAFELLTDNPQATAEPASTCVFCSKPHNPQSCPEMRAMLFAPDADRTTPDAYTIAADAGAFGPTPEATALVRQMVMDGCRREVAHLSIKELRARYIARSGDTRPSRKMKIGDYIELEVLHALNVHMAREFAPLDVDYAPVGWEV